MMITIDIDLIARAIREKKLVTINLDNGEQIIAYDADWIDKQSRNPFRVRETVWPSERIQQIERQFNKGLQRLEVDFNTLQLSKTKPDAMRPEDV